MDPPPRSLRRANPLPLPLRRLSRFPAKLIDPAKERKVGPVTDPSGKETNTKYVGVCCKICTQKFTENRHSLGFEPKSIICFPLSGKWAPCKSAGTDEYHKANPASTKGESIFRKRQLGSSGHVGRYIEGGQHDIGANFQGREPTRARHTMPQWPYNAAMAIQ